MAKPKPSQNKPKDNPKPKAEAPKKAGVIARSPARVKVKPTHVKRKSSAASGNSSKLKRKLNTKGKGKGKGKDNKHKGINKNKGKKHKKKHKNKNRGRDKNTIADRAYEEYLQKMNVGRGAKVSVSEMNNVVREKVDMEVRYENEMPALFSNMLISASGMGDEYDPASVSVENFVMSPFGASFAIQNNGGSDVYLSKDGMAIFNINGGTLIKREGKTTVVLPSKAERGGESAIEFTGNWIQSLTEAQSLGQWVLAQQGDGGEEYSLEIYGNPYLDVGDVIILEYGELNITDSLRFVIQSIAHDYQNGLKTSITVRRIYPNAAKMFTHTQGISQAPEGESLLN